MQRFAALFCLAALLLSEGLIGSDCNGTSIPLDKQNWQTSANNWLKEASFLSALSASIVELISLAPRAISADIPCMKTEADDNNGNSKSSR